MREMGTTGLEFIALWEGFSPCIYLDIAGYITIGIGHKILKGEIFDTDISLEQALTILDKDADNAERGVGGLISVALSDLQFDAIVSFTFNLGTFALQRSTLRSRLNRGDFLGAADEFPKWIFAGGRKSQGLLNRRCAERAIFLAGTE